MTASNPNRNQIRRTWDAAAPEFDKEADHGLRDPRVRQAWRALLREHLPTPPLSILDIGCGTGSLSVLLAEMGYTVCGVDLSPRMISLAREKAASAAAALEFQVMDAARPRFARPDGRRRTFDAILCRHLLWALPEPRAALARWARMLNPNGRLLLIEGRWHTGAGLSIQQTAEMLPPGLELRSAQVLSQQPDLWGKPVQDERYLIAASK